MKQLQDNLHYYRNQKQNIINNTQSYMATSSWTEYGAWQNASCTFTGYEILQRHGLSWWYGVHWKKGRSGQHMKSDQPTVNSIRQDIAQKLGRSADEIDTNLVISARGETPTHHTGYGDAIMFNTYTVGYKYRHSEQKSERFFDQARKNNDLAICEQNITNTENAIRAEHERIMYESQAASLNQAITKNNSAIAEAAAATNAAKMETSKLELQLKQANTIVTGLAERLNEAEQAVFNQLKSVDNKQRTFLLSELWNDPKKAQIIHIIKSLGLEANYLAELAIKKVNSDLFDLSLSHGADCSNFMLKGQTLLQHLIHRGNEAFIQKILAKNQDLATTLINSIAQNDMQVLDKLLAHNAHLLQEKFYGFTLLQVAIAAENPQIEVIQKLLSLNSASVNITSNNNESALKIAVRCGNEEVIKMITPYINLKTELEQLSCDIDQSSKAKILKNNDTEALLKLLKGEQDVISALVLAEEVQVNEDGNYDELDSLTSQMFSNLQLHGLDNVDNSQATSISGSANHHDA